MPHAAEDSVLQRLDRLERAVSRWRSMGWASLAIGNDVGPSLLLMDQQKKVRVGLTVLGDGRPSLGLIDAQGTPTLRFLDGQGPVIWLAP
jgi:hypothetical protein